VALTPKDPIRFVRSLAFSPDSKILASADNRGLVHFWDLATGQSRTVFDHRDSKVAPWSRGAWVLCIVFSPDGKKLAIVLATGVIIWDTETERELCLLHPDRKGAYPKLVVFSPEGTHLVVVSGPMLDVWDLGTYRTIRTQRLEGFSGGGCLAYSPQAKLVAAAINVAGFESPSRVVIWDEDTGGELSNFIAFQVGMSGTTPLAFSPDGELLAAGDVNGVVKVWKVADFVPGKPTQEAPDIPSSPTERAPDDRGKPPANTASRATSAAADRSPTPSHVP
jgi:WD40 repeat protein